MPQLDRTGPRGQGLRTGLRLGNCGNGMRQGYGCSHRRFISPNNELTALEQEEKILEEELAIIKEEKVALKEQLK